MSGIAPRNATVTFVTREDGSRYVKKKYRAIYTAAQEQDAYHKIQPLLQDIKAIRSAQVLNVDESSNVIYIEYIHGESLYELAMKGNITPILEWKEPLIDLFDKARKKGVRFDGDPSNFILHAKSGELVIIDPVCTDLQLNDFAMVVFLWGLIKVIIRSLRFWRYPFIIRVCRIYYRSYLQQTGVVPHLFGQEMIRYIDVVIEWNKEVSSADSRIMILLRRIVAVPIYTTVKWFFYLTVQTSLKKVHF